MLSIGYRLDVLPIPGLFDPLPTRTNAESLCFNIGPNVAHSGAPWPSASFTNTPPDRKTTTWPAFAPKSWILFVEGSIADGSRMPYAAFKMHLDLIRRVQVEQRRDLDLLKHCLWRRSYCQIGSIQVNLSLIQSNSGSNMVITLQENDAPIPFDLQIPSYWTASTSFEPDTVTENYSLIHTLFSNSLVEFRGHSGISAYRGDIEYTTSREENPVWPDAQCPVSGSQLSPRHAFREAAALFNVRAATSRRRDDASWSCERPRISEKKPPEVNAARNLQCAVNLPQHISVLNSPRRLLVRRFKASTKRFCFLSPQNLPSSRRATET
ncbi:hypothetical protein C8R43DRAFT_1197476 [Mycena crocata]|nr:hypothetical protein C8R43DRAFT_1197476 [Mycena crocata]